MSSNTTTINQKSNITFDYSKLGEFNVDVPGMRFCKLDISGFPVESYRRFDPDGYRVMCTFGEAVGCGIEYYPQTATVHMNLENQAHILDSLGDFIPRLAEDIGSDEETARILAGIFFADKDIIIQPVGLQGSIYRAIQSFQNSAPMMYTAQSVSTFNLTGLCGLKIIKYHPLTFVGATYVGAVFFGYLGCIAGNGLVGTACKSASFVLSRPMRGIEVVANKLMLVPLSNLVGVPLILNGTQELLKGKGIPLKRYAKISVAFDRVTNMAVVKKVLNSFSSARGWIRKP